MAKAHRYSRQRDMIYEYLENTHEHPTAEKIHTDLREAMPELSLGTVYRNLKLLEELGRVRRVTSHQGNERYDAICGDHVHFLCEDCGAIRDLEGIDLRQLQSQIPLDAAYHLTKMDMIITGRCPQCS